MVSLMIILGGVTPVQTNGGGVLEGIVVVVVATTVVFDGDNINLAVAVAV